MCFWNYCLQKTWLLKCIKGPVSENLEEVNVLTFYYYDLKNESYFQYEKCENHSLMKQYVDNPGLNILELYKNFVHFWFTLSKTEIYI